MKKLILFFLILASCQKANMTGYRIYNLSGYDLTIITPESTYNVQTTKFVYLRTSGPIKYQFDDPELKAKVTDLHTSSEKHIQIGSYRYDFRLTVSGGADSADIYLNGQLFRAKLPFDYGSNSVNNYQIYCIPKGGHGDTWTIVYTDGFCSNYYEHVNGLPGNLHN